MPSSSRPRRPYRAQQQRIPVLLRFSEHDGRQIKLMAHASLAAIREGAGSKEDWDTLAGRLNLGLVLSRLPEYQGVAPDFDRALNGLVSLKERALRTGRWVATGDELKAMGEALVIADDIQDGTTRKDLLAALQTVMRESKEAVA